MMEAPRCAKKGRRGAHVGKRWSNVPSEITAEVGSLAPSVIFCRAAMMCSWFAASHWTPVVKRPATALEVDWTDDMELSVRLDGDTN